MVNNILAAYLGSVIAWVKSHPSTGIFGGFAASFISYLKSTDLIPDGLHEIVAFVGVVMGLAAAWHTIKAKWAETKLKRLDAIKRQLEIDQLKNNKA